VVSSTAQADGHSPAVRLGLKPAQVVQEIGYDHDCDQPLREAIESLTGSEMVDDDYDEVVDAVLLWWREGDGDLVDALINASVSLAGGGTVWLLTPKVGRQGHVDPADIADSAPTAGLSTTTSLAAAPDWSATRLVAPRYRG
jgi:Protein of unknown function (DUF3052)